MRGWSATFALVVLCLCSPRASAYCLRSAADGSHLTWKQQVPYYVSDSVTDPLVLAAIDAAFASWEAVSCATLEFSKAGSFPLSSTAHDDHGEGIFLFWYDSSTFFPIPAQYVASSVIVHDGEGGIVAGSVLINGFAFDWATDGRTNALDVQAQVTALVGQVIGLDDSDVADSVMSSPPSYGDLSKRSLTTDDEEAVRYLYPDSSCSPPPAPAANGCSGSSSGGSSSGGTSGGGCNSSSQCGAQEVCTIEGTCVPGDVGQNNGGGGCNAFTDCTPGFVCTAEHSCVQVGDRAPAPEPEPEPPPEPEPQQPPQPTVGEQRDPTSATGCTRSDQCGPMEVCAAEGVCLPIATSGDSGGCGLAASPPAGAASLLLLALFFERKKIPKRR